LGSSGYVYIADIPPGQVEVEFGDPEAKAQLDTAKAELKEYLAGIISATQSRAKRLDAQLNELDVLTKGTVLTGAFIAGLYDEVASIAETAIMVAESGIELVGDIHEVQIDIVNNLISGNIDAAKQQLEELVTYGEDTLEDMQEAYDTLQLLYTDDDIKNMLMGFPEQYFSVMPTVEQAGVFSSLALSLLLALVTGGAGAAVSAAARAPMFIKAANKIQDITALLKKVKLHRKQSKPHNSKIAEKMDKPKEDKLKEKEKKKFKCDWKNCKNDHEKKIKYKNKGKINRGSYTGNWVMPWIENGPGDKEINPVTLDCYTNEAKSKHLSDAKKTIQETMMNKPIITYATNNHHLIPISAMEAFKAKLGHNAKLMNWVINDSDNGVAIPYFLTDIFRHDIQCHKTSHPEYNTNVKIELKKIEKKSLDFCSRNNQKLLTKKLNKLSNKLRVRIIMWDRDWLLRKNAIRDRKNSYERAGLKEPRLPTKEEIKTALNLI